MVLFNKDFTYHFYCASLCFKISNQILLNMQQGKQTTVDEPIDGQSTNEVQSPSAQQTDANGVEDKDRE